MLRPQDTLPEAWDTQLKIYQSMLPVQRLNIALELTEMSRVLLETGLRKRFPQYSKDQLRSEMFRLWLGDTTLYQRIEEAHLNIRA